MSNKNLQNSQKNSHEIDAPFEIQSQLSVPFTMVPNLFIDIVNISGSARTLWLYLLSNDRSFNPSQKTIAETYGWSSHTVIKAKKELVSLGLIKIEIQKGRTGNNKHLCIINDTPHWHGIEVRNKRSLNILNGSQTAPLKSAESASLKSAESAPHKIQRENTNLKDIYSDDSNSENKNTSAAEPKKRKPAAKAAGTNNKSKKNKSKKKKYNYSQADLATAKKMKTKIDEIGTHDHLKSNLEDWADALRLLKSKYGYSDEEFEKMLRWALNDDFWRLQIGSPRALLKTKDGMTKWDRILVAYKQSIQKITSKKFAKNSFQSESDRAKEATRRALSISDNSFELDDRDQWEELTDEEIAKYY